MAAVGLDNLRAFTSLPIPRLDEVALDGRVALAAVIVTIFVALVTSALPMLRIRASDLTRLLRLGGRGATGHRDRRRVQRALVVAQVALAFVLLASSTLMVRTFVALRRAPLGFDPQHVLTFRIALPEASYATSERVVRFHTQMSERLGALPGVTAVGATTWRPLDDAGRGLVNVEVEGRESVKEAASPGRPTVITTPGYFRTLAIPLLAGRDFRSLTIPNGAEEVIVSEAFAARVLGDSSLQHVIGQRIRVLPTAPWLTIVGVVGSVRDASLSDDPSPIVYLPFVSNAFGIQQVNTLVRAVTVTVRTSGDPTTLAAGVRRELAALDAALPVFDVATMPALVRRSMARTTFTALLLAIAAGVALA
jgi:hypothetical protein